MSTISAGAQLWSSHRPHSGNQNQKPSHSAENNRKLAQTQPALASPALEAAAEQRQFDDRGLILRLRQLQVKSANEELRPSVCFIKGNRLYRLDEVPAAMRGS
jgi:hypothetical protein